MKTVAIISPHFPPSPLAGVHRARHLAKHLPAHGWRPIIIRAAPEHCPEPPDAALAKLVPQTVEQIETGAAPVALTTRIGVSDIGLRGYLHFKQALAALARREPLSAVLITGSPYYPMLLAGWIKRVLHIPVVLDFQDPWVSAEGASHPTLSKAGASHLLSLTLEPKVMREATFVTSVSEIQNQALAARYPWFDASRMAAIPIGGDPEDYTAAASADRGDDTERAELEIAYVGTIWPRMIPTLDAVLSGIARLRVAAPSVADRLKVRFYGTDASMRAKAVSQVAPRAASLRLGSIIEERPERLPFIDSLSTMARADALLLLGSDEPHYTASKIYPALMSGRPFLSVFHNASSAHAILSKAGGGICLAFDNSQELKRLEEPIAQGLEALSTAADKLGAPDPDAYSAYTAHAVAGRFAAIFNRISTPCASRS